MLNIIKDILITCNINKLNNSINKEKSLLLKAESKRDMDIAMTKIAETVTDYFIVRDKDLRFADESLLNRLVISRELLRDTLRRCQ